MKTLQITYIGLILLLISLSSNPLLSQNLVVNSGPTIDAPALIENLIGTGVTVSNINLQGSTAPYSYGIFSAGGGSVGMPSGIILHTGNVNNITGPNSSGSSTTNLSIPGDPQLNAITTGTTQDATVLTFDFVPQGNILMFNYVFASEEYNEYVCSPFNDAFGFFITGPDPSGGNYLNENIALLPNNQFVTINTVNNGMPGSGYSTNGCSAAGLMNSAYFVDNSTNASPIFSNIEYDGLTVTLTAMVNVIPCQEYSFKIAVGDVADGALDSGVFLEEGSFSSPFPEIEVNTVLNEGCEDIIDDVKITLSEPELTDVVFTNTLLGTSTATEGADFTPITPILTIPAGETMGIIDIDVIIDFLIEGTETIDIELKYFYRCDTIRDTLNIEIIDSGLSCMTSAVNLVLDANGQASTTIDAVTNGDVNNACLTLSATPLSFNCMNIGSNNVTVTAVDQHGQMAMCNTIVNVTDNLPPSDPQEPDDITYTCDDDLEPALNVAVSTSDNCISLITVTGVDASDVGGGCPSDPRIIIRKWTFTDASNNITVAEQVITIVDNIAPVPPSAPDNVNIQCTDDIPANISLTATDNCSDDISVMGVDAMNGGEGCKGDPKVITRTWTFQDECGNTSDVSQTITIEDTLTPVMPTVPSALLFLCVDDVPDPIELTASDNCKGNITVMGVDTDNNGAGTETDPLIISRTWTFDDMCGNVSVLNQTITVTDDEPPTLPTPPSDVMISCEDDIPAPIDLMATEGCGNMITASPVESDNGGMGCENNPKVITRTWSFTLTDGDVVTVNQLITIVDDIEPEQVTIPADITYECLEDVPAPTEITTTDNCNGSITVIGEDTDNGGSGCASNPLIITRTWTFADDCGNQNSLSQTITIIDEEEPLTPDIPLDLYLECVADVPDAPTLTTTDNCVAGIDNMITVSATDTNNGGSGCVTDPLVITRTWTFEDTCGNSISVYQIITVTDSEAPEVPEAPDNLTISCEADIPPAQELTATDNCSGTILGQVEDISNGGIGCANNPHIITRTWTFKDDCNNISTISQTITISDTSNPSTPEAPADIVLNCLDDIPDADALTSTDNCSGSITVMPIEENNFGSGCASAPYILTRTWVFVDDCESAVSVSQTITVIDNIAPTFTAPENVTIECGTDILDLSITGNVSEVMDNCTSSENLTISYMDDLNNLTECQATGYIIRSWTVEDDCENTSSHEQRIYIQDTQPPDASFPIDITLECGIDYTDNEITGEATSEGGVCNVIAEIRYVDEENLTGCNNTGNIMRTWIVEDECGNTSEMIQVISIVDETAPEAICQDITIVLDDNDMAVIDSPELINNGSSDCGMVALSLDKSQATCDELLQDDNGVYFDVTLTVTDDCENEDTCTARVNVIDTIPPNILCPEDMSFQLGAMECDIMVDYEILVMDNCGTFTLNQIDDTGLTSGDQFPIGVHVLSYEVVDMFGLSSQCSFVIEVIEYVGMGSVICKDDVNISLDENCEVAISAIDLVSGQDYGCIEDFDIDLYDGIESDDTYIESSPVLNGSYVGKKIIYVVTMPNGNTCWGELFIEDKTPPMPDCPCSDPDDLEDECYFTCHDVPLILNDTTITPTPILSEVDNCGLSSYSYIDMHDDNVCASGLITRNWQFIDIYGNESSCTQYFNIESLSLSEVQPPNDNLQLLCTDDNSLVAIEQNFGIRSTYPFIEYERNGNTVSVPLHESVCNLNTIYSEDIVPTCASGCYGGSKLIRKWIVNDWCTQESIEITQDISIVDNESPFISLNDTVIYHIGEHCDINMMLPVPLIHDNCDELPDYLVFGSIGTTIDTIDIANSERSYMINGLNIGNNNILYSAYDCCGNTTVDTLHVWVVDKVAPVVITKEDITVSLTSDSSRDMEGRADLYIESIDDGTYDGCTEVKLEIRRIDVPYSCYNDGGSAHVSNNTYNNDGHPNDDYNDTDEGAYVSVCCDDLGTLEGDGNRDGQVNEDDQGYIKVMLRAWDDANMSGSYGDTIIIDGLVLTDNYNESWTWVRVDDKLPPTISCPSDTSILCNEPLVLSTDFGVGFQSLNHGDFNTGLAIGYGACAIPEITYRDQSNLNDCGLGLIKRTWKADDGNNIATCVQYIEVVEVDTTYITAPSNAHYTWNQCSFHIEDIPQDHRPVIHGESCNSIAENISIDTFLKPTASCKKWEVTYKYWSYCDNDFYPETFRAYYEYENTSIPIIEECDDLQIGLDKNCNSNITICNTADIEMSCDVNSHILWDVMIDIDDNNLIDYLASSRMKNNAWTLLQADDIVNLPDGYKYEEYILTKHIEPSYSGAENCLELPEANNAGNYKAFWVASDGCNNSEKCAQNIEIRDKIAPALYCNNLGTMYISNQNPYIELWADDLIVVIEDNCDHINALYSTFYGVKPIIEDTYIERHGKLYLINENIPHYFNENGFVDFYSDGLTQIDGIVYPKTKNTTKLSYVDGIEITGKGIQLWKPSVRTSGAAFSKARIWDISTNVWDTAGNTSFCIAEVGINYREDENGVIRGFVSNPNGDGIPNAMTLITDFNGSISKEKMTSNEGYYQFENNPLHSRYEINVNKADAYREGISTIDLVMIQRHMLRKKEFDSPYKVIAADVNNDEKIDPLDLLIIRKLILNIINDVPDLQSWVFMDAKQQFTDLFNPWPLKEKMDIQDLSGNMMRCDFIGVKRGDINNSVELRDGTIELSVEDRFVHKNEIINVEFSVNDYHNMVGAQMELHHDGLELMKATSSMFQTNDNNYNSINESKTLFVLDELLENHSDNMLTLTFKVNESGLLSQKIKFSLEKLTSELYYDKGNVSIKNIVLKFKDLESAHELEIYQNVPNPFRESTEIEFITNKEGLAVLEIYDIAGSIVLTKEYFANEGYNSLSMSNDELTAGVYYYKITKGSNSKTLKMIKIN